MEVFRSMFAKLTDLSVGWIQVVEKNQLRTLQSQTRQTRQTRHLNPKSVARGRGCDLQTSPWR